MRRRVALVIDGRDGMTDFARRRCLQLTEIFNRIGSTVDLIAFVGTAKEQALTEFIAGVSSISYVDATLSRDGTAQSRMPSPRCTRPSQTDIVCLPPTLLPMVPADHRLRILDCFDGNAGISADASDLCLTALEGARQDLTDTGSEAMRLPPRLASRNGASPAAQLIGWPDLWDDALSAAWRPVLQSLVRRLVFPTEGLLLGCDGARHDFVPALLRQYCAPETGVPPRRALLATGLGVLPGVPVEPYLAPLLDLIAAGRPVIASSSATASFEDRWHLPTTDDSEEVSDLIAGWVADENRGVLIEAAAATAAAMRRDVDAMEHHIAGVLDARIGS
ncbi:MAG: hypothetical protein AAF334_11900 [Pseudomonadota bacterium]